MGHMCTKGLPMELSDDENGTTANGEESDNSDAYYGGTMEIVHCLVDD